MFHVESHNLQLYRCGLVYDEEMHTNLRAHKRIPVDINSLAQIQPLHLQLYCALCDRGIPSYTQLEVSEQPVFLWSLWNLHCLRCYLHSNQHSLLRGCHALRGCLPWQWKFPQQWSCPSSSVMPLQHFSILWSSSSLDSTGPTALSTSTVSLCWGDPSQSTWRICSWCSYCYGKLN